MKDKFFYQRFSKHTIHFRTCIYILTTGLSLGQNYKNSHLFLAGSFKCWVVGYQSENL